MTTISSRCRRVGSTSGRRRVRFAADRRGRVSLDSRRHGDACVRVGAADPSMITKSGDWREQAHFPAEQPASQPHPWLPSPHADPRRPRDPGRASPQGPRASRRLITARRRPVLPATSRLTSLGRLPRLCAPGRPGRSRNPRGACRAHARSAVTGGLRRVQGRRQRRDAEPGEAASAAPGRGVASGGASVPVDVVVRALPAAASGDLRGFPGSIRRGVGKLAA